MTAKIFCPIDHRFEHHVMSILGSHASPWLPLFVTSYAGKAKLCLATHGEGKCLGNEEIIDLGASLDMPFEITDIWVYQTDDGVKIEWGDQWGIVGAMTSVKGMASNLFFLLEANILEANVTVRSHNKKPLEMKRRAANLFSPQPKAAPLTDTDHKYSGATNSKRTDTMAPRTSAPRTSAPRAAASSSRSKGTADKPKVTPGLCKLGDVEGMEEAGLMQFQYWPAARQERGFLGFAQLTTTHRLVIRDIVVRENKEGEIYASMPAKQDEKAKNGWRDTAYFLSADEETGINHREILNEMAAFAVSNVAEA